MAAVVTVDFVYDVGTACDNFDSRKVGRIRIPFGC